MSRAAMQQALRSLLDLTGDRQYEYQIREALRAITALQAALAEPERAPVESISAGQISKMFHRLEGIDQNQWGYHWKKGWNDALREAMDYCQAAPTPRKPLTDEVIADLWDGHTVPVFGKTGINPIVFARAIERAHGIGEQHE